MNATTFAETLLGDAAAGCAHGNDDTTATWLAIAAGVLTLVSEGMPFTKRVQSNGMCHAIFHWICESGCLDKPVAAKKPDGNHSDQGGV